MRAPVLMPLGRKAGTDAPRPTETPLSRGRQQPSRRRRSGPSGRGIDNGLRYAQHRPRNEGHNLVGQICDEDHHRESVAET